MPLLIGTRKCLLNGTGKRGYRMTFDALPASVVAGLGTLGVAGGALKAATLAVPANAPNLAINNEVSANTNSWSRANASIARVDSESDPGAPSGGADKWALKVTVSSANGYGYNNGLKGRILGAYYRVAARAYAPSGNTIVGAARIETVSPTLHAAVTAEDAWQALLIESWGPAAGQLASNVRLRPSLIDSETVGDSAYFDALNVQRQNAIAWFPPVGVHLSLPVALAMPAAPDVTPIDILVRGADALNYWAVRVTPNTAGNDCQIIEVVAGVETVRAAADVDWTASGTDYVLLDVRGPALTVYAMKQGASVWSPAASYASMATHLSSVGIGVQYYSTTAGPTLKTWEPRAL